MFDTRHATLHNIVLVYLTLDTFDD